MLIMSQELCVNQRNEPSHIYIIVEILLNNILGTLGPAVGGGGGGGGGGGYMGDTYVPRF